MYVGRILSQVSSFIDETDTISIWSSMFMFCLDVSVFTVSGYFTKMTWKDICVFTLIKLIIHVVFIAAKIDNRGTSRHVPVW